MCIKLCFFLRKEKGKVWETVKDSLALIIYILFPWITVWSFIQLLICIVAQKKLYRNNPSLVWGLFFISGSNVHIKIYQNPKRI